MSEHKPERRPAPEVEERSVGGTIGTFAAGVGFTYLTDLSKIAAHETVEKIKDVIHPTSDDEPKIVLPPGTKEE